MNRYGWVAPPLPRKDGHQSRESWQAGTAPVIKGILFLKSLFEINLIFWTSMRRSIGDWQPTNHQEIAEHNGVKSGKTRNFASIPSSLRRILIFW